MKRFVTTALAVIMTANAVFQFSIGAEAQQNTELLYQAESIGVQSDILSFPLYEEENNKKEEEVSESEEEEPPEQEIEETIENEPEVYFSAEDFRYHGVINFDSYRWTWYSEKVLPGGALEIPGRHLDADGYVCDADGYICLASGTIPKGTVIRTPLGKEGKIYDFCVTAGTIDVYVGW